MPLIYGGDKYITYVNFTAIIPVQTSSELSAALSNTDTSIIINIAPGNYTLDKITINPKNNLSLIATDTPNDLLNIRTVITCVDAQLLDISSSNVVFFGIEFRYRNGSIKIFI